VGVQVEYASLGSVRDFIFDVSTTYVEHITCCGISTFRFFLEKSEFEGMYVVVVLCLYVTKDMALIMS